MKILNMKNLYLYFERPKSITKLANINPKLKKNDYYNFSNKLRKNGFKQITQQIWYITLDDIYFDKNRSYLSEEIERFKPNYYNLNFTTDPKILNRRKVGSKKLTKERKELRKLVNEILISI